MQVGVSPAHGLLGVAGEDGVLECFDPRQRAAVGSFDAAEAAGEVSACHTNAPRWSPACNSAPGRLQTLLACTAQSWCCIASSFAQRP